MNTFYNFYLTYVAFIDAALQERGLSPAVAKRVSILLHTIIAFIQLFIIALIITKFVGIQVNYIIYPISFIIFFILSYIHLSKLETSFPAKMAYRFLGEDGKLLMTIYLRILLILDIILLYNLM